jgi:hypothetical protein
MRPIRRVTRTAVLFAVLTLTPLALSPTRGIEDNEVCSAEHPGCVQELDSVCTASGKPVINYYNRSSR